MKKRFVVPFVSAFILLVTSCNQTHNHPHVLVFSKTKGYRHESISKGRLALQQLGRANGFEVDTTENADMFNEHDLKKYAAVVFLCTTGDVLDYKQEIAFERFIQSGGGFAGIHSATETEFDWGWFRDLAGANSDDQPEAQVSAINVVGNTHSSTKDLPSTWNTTDKWYHHKNLGNEVTPLLIVEEKASAGGTMTNDQSIAWYHEFDGGRAFCTGLGHAESSYTDSLFLKHVLGGIEYAIGNNKLDYSKAKSAYPPDESKFEKTVLSKGEFYEPTEMTILPNLDILIVQRRGEILLYKNETKKIKRAGFLDVYFKTKHTPDVNAEEGLLGVCTRNLRS
jgi:cytochrome c